MLNLSQRDTPTQRRGAIVHVAEATSTSQRRLQSTVYTLSLILVCHLLVLTQWRTTHTGRHTQGAVRRYGGTRQPRGRYEVGTEVQVGTCPCFVYAGGSAIHDTSGATTVR